MRKNCICSWYEIRAIRGELNPKKGLDTCRKSKATSTNALVSVFYLNHVSVFHHDEQNRFQQTQISLTDSSKIRLYLTYFKRWATTNYKFIMFNILLTMCFGVSRCYYFDLPLKGYVINTKKMRLEKMS